MTEHADFLTARQPSLAHICNLLLACIPAEVLQKAGGKGSTDLSMSPVSSMRPTEAIPYARWCLPASTWSSSDHCVGNNYDIFTNLAFGSVHTNHYQSFNSSCGCLCVRVCMHVDAHALESGSLPISNNYNLERNDYVAPWPLSTSRDTESTLCWKQFSESIVGNFGTWHRGLLQTLHSWEEKQKKLNIKQKRNLDECAVSIEK